MHLPHTTHYNSHIKAAEFMGCQQLHYCNHGENAEYTSQCIIQEFLQVIGEQIEHERVNSVHASPMYSIMDQWNHCCIDSQRNDYLCSVPDTWSEGVP